MNEEYREAGYIERIPVKYPPAIGEVAPWLQKYGPWLLGAVALILGGVALSRRRKRE